MKLIVGLGNPGARYAGTRHNLGFEVVDEVARRHGLTFESSPVEALMARQRGPTARVMLAKPLTFMNLSGQAVAGLTRFFRIEVVDILVVVDDVNLPLGRLRARPRGSAGGHNGLQSVIDQLGTAEVARLRLGVGRGGAQRGLTGHVLGRFEGDERNEIQEMVTRAADAADEFVEHDILAVMNRYNAAAPAELDEGCSS